MNPGTLTRRRKSEAMTKHLLEIERLLGRRITPVELRSDLFRASRDLYVTVAQKQTEKRSESVSQSKQ